MPTAEVNDNSNAGLLAPAVFLTVQRFCFDRSLPRSSFYKAVKEGQIRPTKRGARTLIHTDEAKRYDAALLSAA